MPADLHPKIVHHDREMGVIALSKSIVGFIPLAGRVDALQPAARAERSSGDRGGGVAGGGRARAIIFRSVDRR